eukprot:SAG22_NODE_258_length_13522_cov_6.989496_11_plen_310_part_00
MSCTMDSVAVCCCCCCSCSCSCGCTVVERDTNCVPVRSPPSSGGSETAKLRSLTSRLIVLPMNEADAFLEMPHFSEKNRSTTVGVGWLAGSGDGGGGNASGIRAARGVEIGGLRATQARRFATPTRGPLREGPAPPWCENRSCAHPRASLAAVACQRLGRAATIWAATKSGFDPGMPPCRKLSFCKVESDWIDNGRPTNMDWKHLSMDRFQEDSTEDISVAWCRGRRRRRRATRGSWCRGIRSLSRVEKRSACVGSTIHVRLYIIIIDGDKNCHSSFFLGGKQIMRAHRGGAWARCGRANAALASRPTA